MAWTAPADWANLEVVTHTKLNTHLRDNMKELWHEVAYVEFTSDVTANNPANPEATPVDIVSAGAITFIAAPIVIQFFTPLGQVTNASINLWDGSTDLGRMLVQGTYSMPIYVERRLTPTAASHTYKFRLWMTGGSSTVHAGAGGTGTDMPGFIRIMQRGG